jgi:hypothetical protein
MIVVKMVRSAVSELGVNKMRTALTTRRRSELSLVSAPSSP